MKNINKLLLIGFIIGCATANILAMEAPETQDIQELRSTGIDSLLNTSNDLTDKILEKILAQYIKPDINALTLSRLEIAINKLKDLRLINKRLAKFLTYTEVIDILRAANIGLYANQVNPDTGEALLHMAIRMGSIALARVLIKSGVDVNVALITPRSPKFTKRFPIGSTPLHIAVKMGYANIVSLLIQHGADIMAKTVSHNPRNNNITPLDIARGMHRQEIIVILEFAYQASGLAVPAIAVAIYPNVRSLDFSNM